MVLSLIPLSSFPPLPAPPSPQTRLLLHLLDKPLRSIVMAGQVLGGMWKRNGYSVLNQVFNYQFHFCQQGMYDMDIIMVKSVAATLTPHVFLHALLHKYRLQDWLRG